jgi:DHA1 family bicyclomycin/chloramphenicol resistance-like MFS transporter
LNQRSLIVLLAFIVTIGSVATNLYIPALPAVRAYFAISVAEAQATFSVALIAFAIGILCWGPIADRYGRRRAILAGLAVMATGALIGMTAQNLGTLIVGRGVQAFGTATGIAVSRAIVSDLFPGERMARVLAQLAIVSVIASGLAPVAGGFLTEAFGWRSVFGALLVAGTAIAWFTWRHLPETRPAHHEPPRTRAMLGVAGQLARNPAYLSPVLQISAAFAQFLVFIAMAPYVMGALGRPPTEYGLYYMLIAAGYALGNWSVTRFAARGPDWTVRFGSALQVTGGIAALAFALAGLDHPLWIFLPMAVMLYGQGLFIPHLTAAAVSQAPAHSAGLGSSALGFVNQMIGAACVQAMGLQSTETAVPMLAFCAAAGLLQVAVMLMTPRTIDGILRRSH